MLKFFRESITKILEKDSLIISPDGFDNFKLLTTLISLYCSPPNLTYVLNFDNEDFNKINESLSLQGLNFLPKFINNQFPAKNRIEHYKTGGVIFTTARILIVDLLKHRVPLNKISGFFILNSHLLSYPSLEAFIIEIFRDNNKEGFVRGFSNSPKSFLNNEDKINQILQTLHVQEILVLTPSLEDFPQIDLIEIEISLSKNLQRIQDCLLKIIEYCLIELVDIYGIEDISLERVLTHRFRDIFKEIKKNDPNSQQKIQNFFTIKNLLKKFFSLDSVSFYQELLVLKQYYTTQGISHIPFWMYLTEMNDIFEISKNVIFTNYLDEFSINEEYEQKDILEKQDPIENFFRIQNLVPLYQANPKWEILDGILSLIEEEIENDNILNNEKNDMKNLNPNNYVLIVVNDFKIAEELKLYLQQGKKQFLQNKLKRYFINSEDFRIMKRNEKEEKQNLKRIKSNNNNNNNNKKSKEKQNKKKQKQKKKKKMPERTSSQIEITFYFAQNQNKNQNQIGNENEKQNQNQIGNENEKQKQNQNQNQNQNQIEIENEDEIENEINLEFFSLLPSQELHLIIQPFENFQQTLYDLKPRFIVLMSPWIQLIRQIESFLYENTEIETKVFLTVYTNSFESRCFNYLLTEEKQSFSFLKEISKKINNQNNEQNIEQNNEQNIELNIEQNIELNNKQNNEQNIEQNNELNIEQNNELNIQQNNELNNEQNIQLNNEQNIEQNIQQNNEQNIQQNIQQNIELNNEQNIEQNIQQNIELNNKLNNEQNIELDIEQNNELNNELNNEQNNELNNEQNIQQNIELNNELNIDLIKDDKVKKEKKTQKQIVLVDNREFIGSLVPFMLYKKGVEVIPLNLEIGDYILSSELCVERKTISDLISSFKSGRLYNQLKEMNEHYKNPILLIEMDSKRKQELNEPSQILISDPTTNIISKITTLVKQFPNMRIIWSQNPDLTANIFLNLKSNHSEPNTKDVKKLTKSTHSAFKMLKKMPGINDKNSKLILSRISNFKKLVSTPLKQLEILLGEKNAKDLYNFLRYKANTEDEEDQDN